MAKQWVGEEAERQLFAMAIHGADRTVDNVWPEGPEDDGSRGDLGHVRIVPPDDREMYLAMADAARAVIPGQKCVPVWLRKERDEVVVLVEDGSGDPTTTWREVIREKVDGSFSHIWEGG